MCTVYTYNVSFMFASLGMCFFLVSLLVFYEHVTLLYLVQFIYIWKTDGGMQYAASLRTESNTEDASTAM